MPTSDHKNAMEAPRAPIIALDLGEKRVGVAVSDALSISIKRLEALPRTNWKQLLRDVDDLVRLFDAQTMVIGLPLRLNGSAGDAALEVQSVALKFARSLKAPVYLQNESLSSVAAAENHLIDGHNADEALAILDSEAAVLRRIDVLVS